MNELPSAAKSVLDLAKSTRTCAGPETRARVRARVEATIAAAALSHGSPSAHGQPRATSTAELSSGKGFLTTTKIMLASGALLFGVGSALYGLRATPSAEAPSPVSVQPAELAEPPSAHESASAEFASAEPAKTSLEPAPVRPAHATRAANSKPAGSSDRALAAEMSLLSQAADALTSNDVARARSMLSEHRRRFLRPQLVEERDGLSLVARCMERAESAQDDAQTFISRRPNSVLTRQIRHACGLQDGG